VPCTISLRLLLSERNGRHLHPLSRHCERMLSCKLHPWLCCIEHIRAFHLDMVSTKASLHPLPQPSTAGGVHSYISPWHRAGMLAFTITCMDGMFGFLFVNRWVLCFLITLDLNGLFGSQPNPLHLCFLQGNCCNWHPSLMQFPALEVWKKS